MATVAKRHHQIPSRKAPAMPRRKEPIPISRRKDPLPGRKQVPKKEVKLKKVPYSIKRSIKDAIINKTVDVIFEKGEDAILRLYDNTLGNLLNNAPDKNQGGVDAKALAEEAFKQVIEADNSDAVRAIVEGDQAAVYVIRKGSAGAQVQSFVTQDDGDPVVHEFDKGAGNNHFVHTVTKEAAANVPHTDEYVVKDVGGILSNLV